MNLPVVENVAFPLKHCVWSLDDTCALTSSKLFAFIGSGSRWAIDSLKSPFWGIHASLEISYAEIAVELIANIVTSTDAGWGTKDTHDGSPKNKITTQERSN